MEIDDDKMLWDSPARTWGPAMYGPDETARWYPKMAVDESYSVFCYKANGTPHSKVVEDDMPAYNKDGVPMANPNLLKSFLQSRMYTQGRWVCDALVKLTALEVRCGVRDYHPETKNPIYGVFPVFHLKTASHIIFSIRDDTTEGVGLTEDQRESAMLAFLFEGRKMPSRKRLMKAMDPSVRKSKKKVAKKSKTSGSPKASVDGYDDEDDDEAKTVRLGNDDDDDDDDEDE
jgi:hypothetical protein